VARFAGVDEIGGRARGGEGRGDLARDMARLAHAGHDQAPARRPDHRDRCDDRPAESILDGVGERRDPAGLVSSVRNAEAIRFSPASALWSGFAFGIR